MLINHSKEVFINGFLGPGKLINKSNGYPKSENHIGEYGGNKFFLNSPIQTTSYLVFFELT